MVKILSINTNIFTHGNYFISKLFLVTSRQIA